MAPKALVLDDVPDNALAIVLGGLPTVEELCQACCVSTGFRDLLYGEHALWSPSCVILPLRMTAVQADSLLKRGGGKIKTVEIEMYRRQDGENVDRSVAIPYRFSLRTEWDEAFQSLTANKTLEQIEFISTPADAWLPLPFFGIRHESFKTCAVAALDALCAIAGELPLSLKKISVGDLAYRGMRRHHVLALKAAPCCRDGKCILGAETCSVDGCEHVQGIEHCCVCKDKLPCIKCHNDDHDPPIEYCEDCNRWRCGKQACVDATPFLMCEECGWKGSCATCVAERETCSSCHGRFCRDPECPRAHGASCLSCDSELCGECTRDESLHCNRVGCMAVECGDCLGKSIATCDECATGRCHSHEEMHKCSCEGSFCFNCKDDHLERTEGHSFE